MLCNLGDKLSPPSLRCATAPGDSLMNADPTTHPTADELAA